MTIEKMSVSKGISFLSVPHPSALLLLCSLGLMASPVALAKSYKGGEVSTLTPEQYGRFTMRMQMAKASGTLWTFFTYKEGSEISGTFWEEIDIEVLGKNNATGWQTNIIIGDPRETTEGNHNAGVSLADAYHTYTLEWTDTYVAWFLDGSEVRRITDDKFIDALQNRQDLRFNLWAASIPEWVGSFDSSALPIHQFINWFQYESYDPDTSTFSFEWRDDFDSFDSARWKSANHTFDVNLVDFVSENVLVRDGTMILALTHEGQTGFSGTVPSDVTTPTPTPTVTPTPTPTVTPTPTPVVTPTPTPTPTPVVTPTPTPTPTPNTGGTIDCTGVAVYPNWVSKDWSGGAYNHNKAGESMTYSGYLFTANWYTRSLPGSDMSWTLKGQCQ